VFSIFLVVYSHEYGLDIAASRMNTGLYEISDEIRKKKSARGDEDCKIS
jgi:hypothetical protein